MADPKQNGHFPIKRGSRRGQQEPPTDKAQPDDHQDDNDDQE